MTRECQCRPGGGIDPLADVLSRQLDTPRERRAAQNWAEIAQKAAEQAETDRAAAESSAADAQAGKTVAQAAARSAAASESAAEKSAGRAAADAAAADEHARQAQQSEKDAGDWSGLCKSYAVGEGAPDRHPNEETDNARYYAGSARDSKDAAAASVQVLQDNAEAIQSIRQNLETIQDVRNNMQTVQTVSDGMDAVQEVQANLEAVQSARDNLDAILDAPAQAEAAAKSALEAQSYAHGKTQSREGEDNDNAAYYYDQVKRLAGRLSSGLLPMGTVAFAQLETAAKDAGYMYNISDEFTTDDTFEEGAGHRYPAGTNVYRTGGGKWDALAGGPYVIGVKGAAQSIYQTGEVELTAEDVGAMPAEVVQAKLKQLQNLLTTQQKTAVNSLKKAVDAQVQAVGAKADGAQAAAAAATARTWQLTAALESWAGDDAAGYTQTVAVPGMTAAVQLAGYLLPVLTGGEELEQKKAIQAAMGCISELSTGDGSVTLTCYDAKPEQALTLIVTEVR